MGAVCLPSPTPAIPATMLVLRAGLLLITSLLCHTAAATSEEPKGETWWSLRALAAGPVPQVVDGGWCRSPVDRFVLAKLQEKGLQPSAAADRRTLLRRVTVDLTGLPPTPEELADFEADRSPQAYEKVVDRLLQSPRYGERMARRWMDLVHFAESHGHDEDKHRLHAWPYRDYLIRSFNEDKPYVRFVQEQVAGDALFPREADGVVALGLLAAGPWDQSSQMGIMDGTLDKQFARYLDRDDIVTTVMSTFTSLTVHCARCHDHKFDPISMDDYYALQAVFAGVERVNRSYDTDPAVAAKRAALRGERKKLEQIEVKSPVWLKVEWQDAVEAWEATQPRWRVLEEPRLSSTEGATLEGMPDLSVRSSDKRPDKDTITVTGKTPLLQVTALRLELLTDPSLPHQGPGRQDNGNLHLNEIKLSVMEGDMERPVKIARATSDFDQTGWTVGMAIDKDPKTAWGIYPKVGQPHVAVFEMGEPLASTGEGLELKVVLDQHHGGGHLLGRFRLSVTDAAKPEKAVVRAKELTEALALEPGKRTELHRKVLAKEAALAGVDAKLKELPAASEVYAVASDFAADGNFKPPLEPRKVDVLRRGDIRHPLRSSTPGALKCVTGVPARFDVPGDESARRAALAKWLTNRDNPLPWRSLANRLWQWHFGRGLAASANDFGKMGEAPTHPELLDWLAGQLRDGKSIKSMQRLLVTSAVYRQSSNGSVAAHKSDPTNQWLGRMHRTRLDAEAVRDGVLQVSGQLDLKMYGPSVKHFHEKPGPHVTPIADYDRYVVETPGAQRRSVYRFIFRTVPDPLLDVLDCPDASQLSPRRGESATALQALTLLNHPFMTRMSEHLAARVQSEAKTPAGQIVRLFQLVLLRPPAAGELKKFETFVEQHGLANACRVLLNCNEFHFVD